MDETVFSGILIFTPTGEKGMDRRSVLAATVTILAGCGQLPSTDTSTPTTETATDAPTPTTTSTSSPTESETATPTATEEPTPAETETPTATETPELSEREERAARELDRAISELSQAVSTYTGSAGDSLVDVSASSRGFSRPAVLRDLSDADDHIEDARRLASSRQQPRLQAVETARLFLRLCIDTQPSLIAAFGDAQSARDAVEDQREAEIESATRELRDERADAEQTLGRIVSETDASRVSVVPAIPASDYEAKVDQFDAEVGGFASLADFFDRLRPAVVDLNDAERFDRADRERRAREEAQAAADAFEALSTDLQSFADDLPEAGTSLEGLASDLADIATTKAEDARELVEDNS